MQTNEHGNRPTEVKASQVTATQLAAEKAWIEYLDREKMKIGMPGLMSRPSFIAGYMEGAAGYGGANAIVFREAIDAINGVIAYGRMGIHPPPAGHWLTEYWAIGQQLAELGKTSAWDNQTPVEASASVIEMNDAQLLSVLDQEVAKRNLRWIANSEGNPGIGTVSGFERHGIRDAIRALLVFMRRSSEHRAEAAGEPSGIAHPDDVAVDRFAVAMKEKLAQAREKGRGGWEQCDPVELSIMVREHVEKGDPRDVANFCMFLWHIGQTISDAALPYGKRAATVAEQSEKLDAPAQVGNTVFRKGINTRLVIEAAQRNYQRLHNPSKEDKRMAAGVSIALLRDEFVGRQQPLGPEFDKVLHDGLPDLYITDDEQQTAQQQAELVVNEQALFEAAITKLSETTTFEKIYEDTELNSFWALWREARAAGSGRLAAAEEGWKLVPEEPTQAMRDAGFECIPGVACALAVNVWKAMFAAAPTRRNELAKGCTRSHPHEHMDAACQRKSEEARAGNFSQQTGLSE